MTFSPKHILVPVALDPDDDFSLAEHSVGVACDLAEKYDAIITLLHLAPPVNPGSHASIDVSGKIYHNVLLVLQAKMARGRVKLDELQRAAEARGITVQSKVLDSLDSAAHVICEAAVEFKSDLIVISSHDRKGISRFLLGSVAEKVAHLSIVPVLFLHSKIMSEKK